MGGSPKTSNFYAQRIVVGVGDMTTSNNTSVVLSTYALGSCVGVVAYDPINSVGGILHFMLPDSRLSVEKAKKQPSMFADTGVKVFMDSLAELGVDPQRTNFFIAGGASVISQNTENNVFKIGERNVAAAKAALADYQARILDEDIGGFNNRTLHLILETGVIEVKTPSGTKIISLQ
ncbi:MAG: chemotaxis protein CheD [Verrucomicrobia bacterium CG1_02_43_26]|nr:MAG: chemotaxis protein CheD [Verrucomicrobia bacterium CG1_02_43_26]